MENNPSLSSQFTALVNKLKELVVAKGLVDITIDSREANEHSIFVAIKGHTVDGRDFIPKAIEKGCSVIFKSADTPEVDSLYNFYQEEILGKKVEIIEIYDIESYLSFICLKFYDFLQTIIKPESLGLEVPIIGVTGTNGKTLTTSMIAQGLKLACPTKPAYIIGTVGFGPYPVLHKAKNTTPDAASVMREIFHAQRAKASALVMEVSSHGLVLDRVRNVRFSQAIFTNLTQDHLDFHKTMEEYFKAKAQFFTSHNVRDYIITCNGEDEDYGAQLVDLVAAKLCVEDPNHAHSRGIPAYTASSMSILGAMPSDDSIIGSLNSRPNPLGEAKVPASAYLLDIESKLQKQAYKSRLAVVNIGKKVSQSVCFKADIVVTLTKLHAHKHGLTISFRFEDKNVESRDEYTIHTSLIGTFNAYNLLTAFTSLYLHGLDKEFLLANISQLCAVNGRMQLIPNDQDKIILVDFAHTPDALEKVLVSAKEHFNASQGKLWLVFGCGGDRDPLKRPIMGAIASKYANQVVVTDDNPRSEDPSTIAEQILAGADQENALYVPGREQALEYALEHSEAGDMIIVAGKGHETEQIIKGQTFHFSDQETLSTLLAKASS